MRFKSGKHTHFREYRATIVIPIDEAITIVGRNDYRKALGTESVPASCLATTVTFKPI